MSKTKQKFLYIGIVSVAILLLSLNLPLSLATKVQTLAFIALFFLYISMLVWPISPYFSRQTKHRLSKLQFLTTYFSLLFGMAHGAIAFNSYLGGFSGLGLLPSGYDLAISISSSALAVLAASLYYQFFKNSLVANIALHSVGLLILAHAFLIGTHFKLLSYFIPQIIFYLYTLLLLLIAIRVDSLLATKKIAGKVFGVVTLSSIVLAALVYTTYLAPAQIYNEADLSLHAQKNQFNDQTNEKFHISFKTPVDEITAGKPIQLEFEAFNTNNGDPVKLFERLEFKVPRLVIVDETFTTFQNLALDQFGNKLFVETVFPENGNYRLYVDYQPFGSQEQQSAFVVSLGERTREDTSSLEPTSVSDTGTYTISLSSSEEFLASKLFAGQQVFHFDLYETATSKPVQKVEHHHGRWGTISFVNMQTFDYIHTMPLSHWTGAFNENTGSLILDYVSSGLYAPITPGMYKLYIEFNVYGEIIVGDFVVEVT